MLTSREQSKDFRATFQKPFTQLAFTYSNLTLETLEQGVKYVQN